MFKTKVKCSQELSSAPILIISELLKPENIADIEWGPSTSLEIVSLGDQNVSFSSVFSICRFLARTSSGHLYGKTNLEKTEVDHWLEYCSRRLVASEFQDYLEKLNKTLSMVTYLVGDTITIADICVWSLLYSNKQFLSLLSENLAPQNVCRWYKFLSSKTAFKTVITMFPNENANKKNVTKKEKVEDRGKFTDLPDAEMGKVVVRFPPEASGFLHIGHAKAALLNAHYQVSFQGKLILRFDDTNPEKEKEDFEKVILEDVAMLKIKPDNYTYTSDHFNLLLEKCEFLLKSGIAYVDDTDPETMKNEREQRLDSKNRNNNIAKNWTVWEEMKKGTDYGKSCCVRAKIDMTSDNGCLRDPTLYRCKSMSHPRTLNKYNVYPTYDFACPIVDSIEGVTHALRTTEYHDRDDQYFWILDMLKMRKPYIYEYSRLNMTNTVLSKRKLTWFVDQGIVDGWDDPRMPTVRGVLRRGMTVEGLKQFIVAQGSSRSVVVMEWDKIWAFNKKVIDPLAPRYNAVEKDDFIPVFVEGATYMVLQVAKHPKNTELGNKDIYVGPKLLVDRADAAMMKVGENVTFINWGNLLVTDIKKCSSGEITSIAAKLNLENKDYKKTLKVTWVIDHKDQALVLCTCVYYDHLISKPVLGKDEDFKNFLNENTKIEVQMLGDSLLTNLKKGDIIQVQRKGFFICDEPYDASPLRYTSREKNLVLFSIPDGSKDMTSFPSAVRKIRETVISEKEKLSSLKGKSSEKSPKEELKSICDGQGDISFNSNNEPSIDTENDLDCQIQAQGNLIRNLKTEKADKTKIDAHVQILLKLKKEFKNSCGKDWLPPAADSKSVKKVASQNGNVKTQDKNMLLTKDVPDKEISNLNSKIIAQGIIVRELKSQKAEKSIIDNAVKQLLHLKEEFKKCCKIDWKPDIINTVGNNEPQNEAQNLSSSDLNRQIMLQGDLIRNLKSEKADKSVIDSNVKKLLKLKEDYKSSTGVDWKPEAVIKDSVDNNKPQNEAQNLSSSDLSQQIKLQGDVIRKLKSEKTDKSVIESNVKKLLKLKEDYKSSAGVDWKPEAVIKDSIDSNKPLNEAQNLSSSDLNQQIKLQGDVIRKLKSEKADKSIIDSNVKKLLKLKEGYKSSTGVDWKPEVTTKDSVDVQNRSLNPGSNKQKKETDNKQASSKNIQSETDSNLKKVTRLGLEVKKEENLAEWYSQVLTKAEMIEYYDISGCYILRPWSYSIWEAIQKFFDSAIKSLGVTNCYFPMFVSSNALEKEKTHITDFAPEVAWVTKSGSSELDKAIAIRPTSETVMYPSYAKWIRSHRDLPLRLNQWCNVVRWEFRNPQPFIRTREFLWQEGHTAFATKEEAENEVFTILDFYAQVYQDLLAIPVIKGKKTEKEKFAGADFTTTTEAYVPANGRGIQGATSHHLGQNFSKMFEIMYEDPETSDKQYVYQNSWGLSTRSIGAMVMIHADNTGLILPPRVAAHQVVIVPCGITASLKESEKDHLMVKCSEFQSVLEKANISVKIDFRDNYSPGWKFNYWELKGVPLRIELGPKDIKKNQFVAVRRDTGEKATLNIDSAPNSVLELLDNIHENMFQRAKKSRDEHLSVSHDWSEFCNKLENRFIILSPFCGDISCEDNIKKDSAKNADENLEPGAPSMGAKSLCIPFEQPDDIKPNTRCIHPKCSRKPKYFTLFGRSY